MRAPADIDQYIAGFPPETRTALEQVRATIRTVAPAAEEAISYAMPTFKLEGRNLVHFAGYAHHIGFYPVPTAIEAFKKDLSKYKQGKGSVQFPLDRKIPLALIARIVRFRVKEQAQRARSRKK